MSSQFFNALQQRLQGLAEAGLYKPEHALSTAQSASVGLDTQPGVLNFCANNYLGLANHPKVVAAAHHALDEYGYGMASVRFICGTQTLHQTLEARLARFLEKEDSILFSSCFDANGGLFEALLDQHDAVFSDALNHASLIDGIRLCKAERHVFANSDMQMLEAQLQAAEDKKTRLIVTDGVFSMDGTLANLPMICKLAKQYDALVLVDDSHGIGVLGEGGRGTAEYHNVLAQVDIITGTLGKALGGASGGFVCGARPVIEWLRQRARPYLFSNSLAPMIVAASLAALELAEADLSLRTRLQQNTQMFRDGLQKAGFNVLPGAHPIVPVMLGDATIAAEFASHLLNENIYVVGFSYPVVPEDQARVRVQLSSAHSPEQVQTALAAFEKVGQQLDIIG